MMETFITSMMIQKMGITTPLLQILKDLLWSLVDIQDHHTQTRLRLMTLQPIHGLKLPLIHTMISKFWIISLLSFGFIIYLSIRRFATVTTEQGALIIGGIWRNLEEKDSVVTTVACFNNSGWSRLDDLQSARYNSRAIINGDKVYVVGGHGKQ